MVWDFGGLWIQAGLIGLGGRAGAKNIPAVPRLPMVGGIGNTDYTRHINAYISVVIM